MFIRLPKRASAFEELLVSIIFFGPLLYLFFLWRKGDFIYFEHAFLNVLANSSILIIPIVWAFIFWSPKGDQLITTEEEIISKRSFISILRAEWWQMIMLFPPFVSGVWFIVAQGVRLISERRSFSTHPGDAFITMALAFGLCIFYGAILKSPIITVSKLGIMSGHKFHYWRDIIRVARRGNTFHVFLKTNNHLPHTAIIPRNSEAQHVLEEHIRINNISRVPSWHFTEIAVKAVVAVTSLFTLALAYVLHGKRLADDRWIIILLFIIGILSTMVLERIRRISNADLVPPIFVDITDSEHENEQSSQQNHPADPE